jgi:hypothetical protein
MRSVAHDRHCRTKCLNKGLKVMVHARFIPVLAAGFCVLLTGSAAAVSYEVRVDTPQPSASSIDVLDDSAAFSAGDLTGGVGQDFGASGDVVQIMQPTTGTSYAPDNGGSNFRYVRPVFSAPGH